MLLRFVLLLLWLPAGWLYADTLNICYHYGCSKHAYFEISPEAKQRLSTLLDSANSPDSERERVKDAVVELYRQAGQSTPVWQDKGGNVNDGPADGRMDCVDHSSNVTTFLRYLQGKGWLKYHVTATPQWRAPWIVDLHYTAVLHDATTGDDWAVDSWFKDFGAPPAVVPLTIWKEGYAP